MTKLTESQLAEIAERNHSLFIRLHDVPETLVLPSTAGQFVTDIDALLAHVAAVTAELAAANARADEAERELKDLAEWLRDGFDHEDDAHRYDNGACRKCRGIDVLADIDRGEYEKGGGDAIASS